MEANFGEFGELKRSGLHETVEAVDSCQALVPDLRDYLSDGEDLRRHSRTGGPQRDLS